MQTYLGLAILAGSLLQTAVRADDHGVVFIYPQGGEIFFTQDTINVTYTSGFPTPNLYTFCDGGRRQVYKQPAVSFNGTTQVTLNFTSGTGCWFDLRPGTEPGHGANGKAFNLLGMVRSGGSQTLGPSSSLNTAPPSESSTSTSATAGTPSSTTTSSSSSSTTQPTGSSTPGSNSTTAGLSSGASAGIGVGVTIGVIGLAGAVILWLRQRRRKANAKTISTDGINYSPIAGGSGGGSEWNHSSQYTAPSNYSHDPRNGFTSPSPHPHPRPMEISSTGGATEVATTEHVKHELPAY
ncbi:hypothetical protein B0T17DRAFT_503612 [Bombardia bombarda]|uniref:Uncharacterized protein n=1 Tax=Bombardia bombarda TaxID=252184 RepID=A0AA39XLB2_9PEZI|nr:hypothetical protein B0T17DRAFT_503612 [Bombardia bombarda]